MNAGEIVINTKLETKDFDREIRHLEESLEGLEEEYESVKNTKPFEGQQEYLEQLSKKIIKTKKNLNSLVIEKEKFEKSDLRNVEFQIGNVGKSIEGVTKKVGRWALAVFGVRSAYSFVRNAINTITQDDAQLQADIEFMKKALAYTIEPVVRTIVNLMKTLMQYVAYIVKAWTGRDIFASANKSLKSANKSAKALQKTSASFDKFNKLSASSSGAGGGGATTGFGGLQGDVPKWVKWIAEHKNIFKIIGGSLLIAFGASTIAKILSNIGMLFGVSGGTGLIGLSELLLLIATPIVIAIAVKGVKNVITEVEKLNNVLDDNTKQAKNSKNVTQEIIDKYQELVNSNKITNEQLKNYQNYLKESTERSVDFVKSLENQKTWWGELTGSNKKLNEQQQIHLEKIQLLTDAYKKLYDQNKLDKEGQEQYKKLLENTMDALGKQGKSVEDLQKDYENLTGKKYTLNLEANVDTKKAEKKVSGLFEPFRDLFSGIKTAFTGKSSSGMGGRAKGGIFYPSKLPRLAKGGIVNMPGKGVPYHGATIGERGAEAVVPLTDNAQMELLGASIGKHVKVNVDFTAEIEGRVFARVMKEINAENNFARNGG